MPHLHKALSLVAILDFPTMKVFKESINKTRKMLTVVILGLGVIIIIIGLILGLKNFDPKYFNAIAGSIIAGLTLFGLFGKLFQDISSSNTQQEIKKNTERNLQPFKITAFSVMLEYDFDNPKISNTLKKVDSVKNYLEDLYSKAPPAVNGQRMLPATPGIIAFEENNKINGAMIIEDLNFLSTCNFPFPNIRLQFSSKYKPKIKNENGDDTLEVNHHFPICFEIETIPSPEFCYLTEIFIDYPAKKIKFTVRPSQWNCSFDSGEILSFTDIFGKFLKISSYYNSWKDNQKKINILGLTLFNENKKMAFSFDTKEKSNLLTDFNSAFIHQIKESDFVNKNP